MDYSSIREKYIVANSMLETFAEPGARYRDADLEDVSLSDEEFDVALSLIDGGVFTGDFPPELLSSLFRNIPGANPAV